MTYLPIIPKPLVTIGNLPASYDESLSYLQLLMIFRKNLNEAIDHINQIQVIVNNIDTNFENIYTRLDVVDDKLLALQQELSTLESRITSNVEYELQQNYSRVLSLMNDYQTIFNSNLALMQEQLEQEIRDIELGNVMAYDPTTGTYENVSTVIMNVYETLRNNAITCSEFDSLELTATTYDALEITAYNFDVNGKEFLDVA